MGVEKEGIDWKNLFIPNLDKTYVALDKQHNQHWFPSSDDVMLYLNLTKAPFNDLQVRKAISLALNRQTISTLGEAGYEPPANPTGRVGEAIQSYIDPQFAGIQFTQNISQPDETFHTAACTKASNGYHAHNA